MEVAVKSDNIRTGLAQESLPKGRMLCYTSEIGERALTARRTSAAGLHISSLQNTSLLGLFQQIKGIWIVHIQHREDGWFRRNFLSREEGKFGSKGRKQC